MRLVESKGASLLILRKRIRWSYIVVVVCFFILAGRLFYLQIIKGEEYRLKSEINIIRVQDIPTFRGIIRDSKGRILASNRPSYQLYITPAFFNFERDFGPVCDYLNLSQSERESLLKTLKNQKGLKSYQPFLVRDDISRDELAILETHKRSIPGINVTYQPKRVYPLGRVGAHVIGYLGKVRKEDLIEHPELNYKSTDMVGRYGVEKAFEQILRGRRGWHKTVVNAKGVTIEESQLKKLSSGPIHQDPVPGQDVVLNLDGELMTFIDRLFRGYPSGGAVILEINSGRILALYSKPSFDPEAVSSGLSKEVFEEINSNPFHPWIDRTISATYSPGSTFKIITALAGLAEGVISPSDKVECTGSLEIGKRSYKCTGKHGIVDLVKAITYSCNVYFYNLALITGMDKIAKYATMLGMGEPTNVGINTELKGFIPTRDWYMNKMKMPFMPGYTINMSIGQGNVMTTLIQLANAYATILNGGTLYRPSLVKRIENPDGTPLQRVLPEVVRTIPLSQKHIDILREAMIGVVEDPLGTAHGVGSGEIRVAGKTGTAQVPVRKRKKGEPLKDYWFFTRDHAWFVAFAPADAPEVVAVVLVEHGGVGGKTAAPIAVKSLIGYLTENY